MVGLLKDYNMKKCCKCKETKPLTEFHKMKRAKDGLQFKCKSCRRTEEVKRYKEKKEYFKKYRAENIERQRTRERERRKTNKLYRLRQNTKSRIHQALKKKYTKKLSTIEYLGCDIKFYKEHLQKQFKEGMTWENYGDWHIDHITPINSASTEEELIKLFHYTNTQPLWAEENLKKSDKIL